MGFIDNGMKSSAPVDGTAAYQMAASGDLAGAWMILSRADSSSSVDIVYNKALCLRAAGRRDEALGLARVAFRRLTEGVPQRTFDPVGTALISSMAAPGPMNPGLPAADITYAGLQARWLYCLCLADCGEDEECARVAAPLVQLGIVPITNRGERVVTDG